MKKSKLYTVEFKGEAVKLSRNSGKSYNQIVRDLERWYHLFRQFLSTLKDKNF